MDWQQIISLALVAVTALLFIRNAVRKKTHPSSSSAACANCSGCSNGEHR